MTKDTNSGRPSQEAIFEVPTFFVDGNLGTATGGGVARITLAAYKLNVDPAATLPILHPVVTIVVPEQSLLSFAQEMVARAKLNGVSLEDEKK